MGSSEIRRREEIEIVCWRNQKTMWLCSDEAHAGRGLESKISVSYCKTYYMTIIEQSRFSSEYLGNTSRANEILA